MSYTSRRKLIAACLTIILLTLVLISYAIIIRLNPAAADTTSDPTDWKTTDISPPVSLIKAEPTQGYEPLTVNFYGNPANTSNATSYTWTFGPTGSNILTKDGYTEATSNNRYNKLTTAFAFLFIVSIFTTLIKILINPLSAMIPVLTFISSFGLIISGNLADINNQHQINIHKEYSSTLRDPTMIFLSYGTYNATLTITYQNGTTASDTVWITVLQVYHPPPPPPPDIDGLRTRLQETRLYHYISNKT